MLLAAAFIVLAHSAVGLAAVLGPRQSNAGLPPPRVTTSLGTYQGVFSADGSTKSFLGIPYAQPPVGNLRLRQALPVTPFTGTRATSQFGPACIQPSWLDPGTKESWPTNVQTWYNGKWDVRLSVPSAQQSEDCLTLNIVAPSFASPTSNLPTVVFIHGGGSIVGAAAGYDGAAFVRRAAALSQPVVFVSIQYRLNAFGYLGGAQMRNQRLGNIALYDQRLALTFVQQHINAFGGDRTKVLLFGQSAGSMAVAFNLLADRTASLFRGAWMISGSVTPTGAVDSTIPQATFNSIVAAAGCSSTLDQVHCLRSLPLASFYAATAPFARRFLTSFHGADDISLPYSSYEMLDRGLVSRVPVVNGQVDDEGPFVSLLFPGVAQGTPADVRAFLNQALAGSAFTAAELSQLGVVYPDDGTHRSPFGTPGPAAGFGPSWKYMSALATDLVFTSARRVFLNAVAPINTASFSYNYKRHKADVPQVGAYHGAELFEELFPTGSDDMLRRFLAFATTLDPNYSGAQPVWPRYDTTQRRLLVWNDNAVSIESDNFRSTETTFIEQLYRVHPQ